MPASIDGVPLIAADAAVVRRVMLRAVHVWAQRRWSFLSRWQAMTEVAVLKCGNYRISEVLIALLSAPGDYLLLTGRLVM